MYVYVLAESARVLTQVVPGMPCTAGKREMGE